MATKTKTELKTTIATNILTSQLMTDMVDSFSQEVVASGTYIPTLTNGTNVAGSGAFKCRWHRSGDIVTVSGVVTMQPAAQPALTALGMSLPIASDFASVIDCGGVAAIPEAVTQNPAAILADVTDNRATFSFYAISTTNTSFYFTFSYEII